MWRWVIRVYVAFVVFVILLFCLGAGLRQIDHLLVWTGSHALDRLVHDYMLSTMFLMGLAAGQIYVGSNFTGRGWFRSKSGLTYEGFKLEELKSWNWLIVCPVLLAGILFWLAIQMEGGVLAAISWQSFYRGFLMPECSNRRILGIGGDPQCGIHLMFLGTWMAAVGYSLAPALRKRVLMAYRSLRS
jgi:hypothetical protein